MYRFCDVNGAKLPRFVGNAISNVTFESTNLNLNIWLELEFGSGNGHKRITSFTVTAGRFRWICVDFVWPLNSANWIATLNFAPRETSKLQCCMPIVSKVSWAACNLWFLLACSWTTFYLSHWQVSETIWKPPHVFRHKRELTKQVWQFLFLGGSSSISSDLFLSCSYTRCDRRTKHRHHFPWFALKKKGERDSYWGQSVRQQHGPNTHQLRL